MIFEVKHSTENPGGSPAMSIEEFERRAWEKVRRLYAGWRLEKPEPAPAPRRNGVD